MLIEKALANSLIPDPVIRLKIRSLLKKRLKEESHQSAELAHESFKEKLQQLSTGAIAEQTDKANEQHYQVPSQFYQWVLGPHLKYSSGLWNQGTKNLAQAELAMLETYVDRAQIKAGQKILDLGCGWGSLSLFLAQKFPDCQITGVSNSSTQKKFIDEKARQHSISNLNIETADINQLELNQKYDRILSIEMFEHMRNYQELLAKVSTWLRDDGLLFIHIFTHKYLTYFFDVKSDDDWMSRYFFSGGIMPGNQLLYHFNQHVRVVDHWVVNGMNYAKTAEAWLSNMDRHQQEITQLFASTYGKQAKLWQQYWRIFFMSCAELWNFNHGHEWLVSHYLLKKNLGH